MLDLAARCSRFVRSIASTSYRNVAAVQEPSFSAGEDIVMEPKPNEEDRVAMKSLKKVLINARENNQPPGEALKTYDGPFTLEGVSKVMSKTKDVQSARAIIDWACRQPGFYFTSRLMSNILRGLNSGGQLDEAKKLVFEELQEKFKPTPTVYRCLARQYIVNNKVDDLEEFAEELRKQGIDPDDTISRFILVAKSKESGVKGMLQLFKDKLESGIVPNAQMAEGLMFKLCGSEMWTEAVEVYNTTRSKDVFATERCMSFLMKELCQAKKLDEAYTVTKHLLEHGFRSNSPPFKTVINSLCEAGRLDDAYGVFNAVYDKISLQGMHLVEAFCKAENVDKAMEVLDMLKAPDKEATHFEAVIALLCKGDRLEEARKVMDRMLEAGISPDGEICNLLVEGYVKRLPEDDPRRNKFES